MAIAGTLGLATGLGWVVDGREGALTGATLGLSLCVLAFTVSTTLWALGVARRYRGASRDPARPGPTGPARARARSTGR